MWHDDLVLCAAQNDLEAHLHYGGPLGSFVKTRLPDVELEHYDSNEKITGYKFGEFYLYVHADRFGGIESFITQEQFLYGHLHPHVSDAFMCTGNNATSLNNYCLLEDWDALIALAKVITRQYNPRNSYRSHTVQVPACKCNTSSDFSCVGCIQVCDKCEFIGHKFTEFSQLVISENSGYNNILYLCKCTDINTIYICEHCHQINSDNSQRYTCSITSVLLCKDCAKIHNDEVYAPDVMQKMIGTENWIPANQFLSCVICRQGFPTDPNSSANCQSSYCPVKVILAEGIIE